ncbi:MAG: hypothetical protein JNK82_25260, partial [Myxococcaceae bacterium]|nr:hypothetical protein [Myxococcaceae bacterium]
SAAELERHASVQYVTKQVHGSPRSGAPVVLALEAEVFAGLRRFAREEVTDLLVAELSARAAHEKLAQAEQIRFSGEALVRRPMFGSIEGEVVLAPSAEGRLELFVDRRPLCTIPGALPLPLAAALNFDRLTPSPLHDRVERDAAFQKVVDAAMKEAPVLGGDLAARWAELRTHPAAVESALRLCALYGAERRKKKKLHPLFDIPLLGTTDRRELTVRALVEADSKNHGKVLWASRSGALLDGKPVWHASREQREWLEPLGFELRDVTGELEQADRVRARPKVAALRAPLESTERERIDMNGVTGEVALPALPSELLNVDLHQEHALLERYEDVHTFGGAAAVNCDGLKPNATWTKAARNAQFREVMLQVEKALERALARRLQSGRDGWEAWALNAVKHAEERGGPVADVVPGLPLFESLAGDAVTVGTVVAEYTRSRRIAVAAEGKAPEGRLILKDSAKARQLLEALRVTVKDVSDELLKQGEAEAQRQARRVSQLAWAGEALVRMKVEGPGVSGELALPAGETDAEVMLVKEGIGVQTLPRVLAPGVVGVVDVRDLLVNEDWSRGDLAPPDREQIEQHVDALMMALCKRVPSMAKAERPAARRHVLAWVRHAGVSQAASFDRLSGVSAELARAPVFETAGGEWVGLAVLAEEVRRRGRLAVFTKTFLKPDTGGVLGLAVKSHDEPWLAALEGVLGKGSLEPVKDAGLWREKLSEEDPPEGSREAWSLGRLRRDVRLLRAGALGALSPEDLDDVRLRKLGGAQPVHYDVRRKLVLLDAEHPQVQRALAEGKLRRERLYVLLAAMYGAINRALERITDTHEEALALALARHLAENPQLLDGE